MRVGLVCPYDMGRPGGVQDQVRRIARWLRAAGHEAGIIAPGECDDDGFIGVGPATIVPANGAATPVALAPAVRRRVLGALEPFEVVHIHEPLMPQVSLAALRGAPNPLVGTFHADVSRGPRLAYTLARPVTRRWIERLDVITAVSRVAARAVEFTDRVRIIPNGIDVEDYTPEEKTPGSVAFLGRDDPRKGLQVLLAAWPRVRERQPGATLTVLGADAPADTIEGVVFAGRVGEREKQAILARTTVFCAPNLSGESFGIVVAEGMAAGCAVVASALPGFVAVLGDSGALVAAGDTAGLAAAIGDLLDDPAHAGTLGAAARSRVKQYDGSVVAARYVAAYEEAIGQNRASSTVDPD